MIKFLRTSGLLFTALLLLMQLNGCATVTALAESAITPPSISDTIDSFESAALAIKTSNRILLSAPISEEEAWPELLYKMPSSENTMKMAVAGAGAYFGVTIPTEFDKETGFPRPTSPLYLLIKDRNKMLDKELKSTYTKYFKNNPGSYQCAISNKKPDCTNEYAYRNPLMAFGTVSGNSEELAKVELHMNQMEKGFRECDAWLRKSKEGDVASAYCKDPALKDDDFKVLEIKKTKEQLENDKKVYGKLSKRVYQASVAGADFTAAAMTKVIASIVKFPLALKNAQNEIKGWKGAVNIAMLLPRMKNLFKSIGIYKDNLGLQYTAYKTMYKQIEGNYDVEDKPATKEANLRIENFEKEYAAIRPQLELLAAGKDITFDPRTIERWELMAAVYNPTMAQEQVSTASNR